jgi:hypothetical protein
MADDRTAATTEDVLRDALMVAADLLQQDGYDRDPDYRQEWQTIKEALDER